MNRLSFLKTLGAGLAAAPAILSASAQLPQLPKEVAPLKDFSELLEKGERLLLEIELAPTASPDLTNSSTWGAPITLIQQADVVLLARYSFVFQENLAWLAKSRYATYLDPLSRPLAQQYRNAHVLDNSLRLLGRMHKAERSILVYAYKPDIFGINRVVRRRVRESDLSEQLIQAALSAKHGRPS